MLTTPLLPYRSYSLDIASDCLCHEPLALHQAIETLSDSECSKLLLLINTWHSSVAPALVQLAENPTFHVPSQTLPIFPRVVPIHAEGPTASAQLIEERR